MSAEGGRVGVFTGGVGGDEQPVLAPQDLALKRDGRAALAPLVLPDHRRHPVVERPRRHRARRQVRRQRRGRGLEVSWVGLGLLEGGGALGVGEVGVEPAQALS
eukprot:COSAG04_NODE_6283_length_1366_cov_1.336227_3_plen_103_part_01